MSNQPLVTVNVSGAPNVAQTDQLTPLANAYQQVKLPSLARVLCQNVKMQGPSASVFALDYDKDDTHLIMKKGALECFESKPINTGISREAYDDICATYGENIATVYLAQLLKARANEQENTEFVKFLQDNAIDAGAITISDKTNADTVTCELSNSIAKCVMQMNKNNNRSYAAFAILPYELAGSIMTSFAYMTGTNTTDINELRVASFGLTRFYVNPDSADTNVYVGLLHHDGLCGTAFFGDYTSDLSQVIDPDSGNFVYFIFNRYGFAMNPIHSDENPLLYKFVAQ